MTSSYLYLNKASIYGTCLTVCNEYIAETMQETLHDIV